jgi:hypothetical protein
MSMQDQSETFCIAKRSIKYPDKVNEGWTLDQPGPQTYPTRVWFPKWFHTTPTVSAHIPGIDGKDTDGGPTPVQLTVTRWTTRYFEVEFSKEGGDRIQRVDVEWSAQG